MSTPARASVTEQSHYNILLLGQTQAGKSTFIQEACRYASPDWKIDKNLIGTGYVSCTDKVIHYPIATNLPTVEVVDTSRLDSQGHHPKVENAQLLSTADFESYEDALNNIFKSQKLLTDDTGKQPIHFHLYDTPGLNDTNGYDEVHVANIYDEVNKLGNIHLVLIVVGEGPFSTGFQKAIRCYLDVFPQFKDIMAFVHTKTNYLHHHKEDPSQFKTNCLAKIDDLHNIIGSRDFIHFWIDCDLWCKKPLRQCITLNMMKRILRIATLNQRLSFKSITMNKTPTMKAIDQLVENKYGDLSRSLADILRLKGEVKGNLMSKMFQLSDAIAKNESDQVNVNVFLRIHDTGDPILMDQVSLTESWNYIESVTPGVVTLGEQSCPIDLLTVYHPGFDIYDEVGGEGSSFWSANYKRISFRNGEIYARAYVRKSNMYRDQIEEARGKLTDLIKKHKELKEMQLLQAEKSSEVQAEVDALTEENSFFAKIVRIVREDKVRPDLFRALAEAGAYRGEPIDNIQMVVKVFAKFLGISEADIPALDRSAESVQETVQDLAEMLLSPLAVSMSNDDSVGDSPFRHSEGASSTNRPGSYQGEGDVHGCSQDYSFDEYDDLEDEGSELDGGDNTRNRGTTVKEYDEVLYF